jgi:hypothetical protein
MAERDTIFARLPATLSPRDIVAAALARLDGDRDAAALASRAAYLLAELQRHGYRVKRR